MGRNVTRRTGNRVMSSGCATRGHVSGVRGIGSGGYWCAGGRKCRRYVHGEGVSHELSVMVSAPGTRWKFAVLGLKANCGNVVPRIGRSSISSLRVSIARRGHEAA